MNKVKGRRGKKRPIQVWGCDLEDGTRIDAGKNGIVSVIVHGDRSVSVRDEHNNETIVENARWVSYIPRTN